MRWTLTAWLAVAVAAHAARGEEASAIRLDGVAAYVNEHVITLTDVLMPLEPVRRQLGRQFRGDELAQRLGEAYTNMLANLVERRLILDAYEAGEARIPEWVIDQRVDEVIEDSFGGDRANLMDALAREQMTFDEWRDTLEDLLIVQSMRGANVEQIVRINPADVRAYYDAHPAEFLRPPAVRVRMVALKGAELGPAAAEALAEALVKLAREGHEFALLARQHSSGTHAAEGGDWGWIDPDRELAGELAATVKALEPGEVSDPVAIAGNWYIVKLEGRRAESVADFADVQASIERDLRRRAADEAYAAWVARLREDAYVKIVKPSPPDALLTR